MMVEDPMRRLAPPSQRPQDAYRQVNARSQGGSVDYGYSGYPSHGMQLSVPGSQGAPKVNPNGSVRPRTAAEVDVLQNPIQTQWKNRGNITSAKNYQGRTANDNAWADRVNAMGSEQLNALLAPGTQAWQSRQSPANAAKAYNAYRPGSISVSPGSQVPQSYSLPLASNGRMSSDALGNMLNTPIPQATAQQIVQGLAQTPVQSPGFDLGIQRPLANNNMYSRGAPAGTGPYANSATEAAVRDFNQTAQGVGQPISIGKIIEDRIMQNIANAGMQGRQAMNDRVDANLQASDQLGRTMGGSDYRAAGRTGVIPPRGMGALPSDAGVMARIAQPLGDGGPAAYAAQSDQANRRRQAEEAMGGVGRDGLTRYMPNQDLLEFANRERAKEDERISGLTGGASNYREPLEAMTPAEIQFYRNRMNMLTNPAFANRVNAERVDRQEMLDNRRNMVRARREGALEAAGASQQMRNLMAGRGAVGPGADGMAALTSLAARTNPALALNHNNQMAMMDRRAELERDMMDRATRMAIFSSGMSGPEMDLALQRLDAANNGTPITSPLQTAGAFTADPNKSPMDNYLAFQQWKDNAVKAGAVITPEQERQIMMSQGINPSASDMQRWRQDTATFFDSPDYTGGVAGPAGSYFIVNPILEWLGLTPADMMQRQRTRERLQP